MNIRETILFFKDYFRFTNAEVAAFFGISKEQVYKLMLGHKNLRTDELRRISQISRISMDELMDNSFILPYYHFSPHTQSTYHRADRDYPEFQIQKEDFLYVRPFFPSAEKKGQLLLTYDIAAKQSSVIQFSGHVEDAILDGHLILLHIVGKGTVLYQPIEDTHYQDQLRQNAVAPTRKRGRPIKLK